MVKLLNHWGFDEKGFISKEQLHKVINRKIGCEVEEKDIEVIMRKHSSNQEHINS
jgi:Ca2+-binding EF-hand superfamily protein